jgi:4-diphosphocytidyl-2-C-methyl-D-erythritol kinase
MTLGLVAPAKVNLGLAVLRRRADGYHEIESLMATLDVGDALWLERAAEGVALEVRGRRCRPARRTSSTERQRPT